MESEKVQEEEEEEAEEDAGETRRGTAGVSRLVTLVTERWLAEKRRRLVVRCSVIEKISLSLSFFPSFPL